MISELFDLIKSH